MSDTMTDTKATTREEKRDTPSDFFWYELMTPDQEASEAFYTKVVGWTAAAQSMDGHGNAYVVVSAERILHTPVRGDGSACPDSGTQWKSREWVSRLPSSGERSASRPASTWTTRPSRSTLPKTASSFAPSSSRR